MAPDSAKPAAESPRPEVDIGFVLFPKLTQLDLTGPWEALARVPGVRTHLVAKTLATVLSDTGLSLVPTIAFSECPDLDVVCVPGGPGSMTPCSTMKFSLFS